MNSEKLTLNVTREQYQQIMLAMRGRYDRLFDLIVGSKGSQDLKNDLVTARKLVGETYTDLSKQGGMP